MRKRIIIMLSMLLTAIMLIAGMPGVSLGYVQAQETEEDKAFVHPGILHTEESFAAMKRNVLEKNYPTINAWDALKSSSWSNANYNPDPRQEIIRGANGANNHVFYQDIERAYQCALIWKISGSESHGAAASRILNAWARKTTKISGEWPLVSGLQGYQIANVSEIVREREDFDYEAMKAFLLNVVYPLSSDFPVRKNGTLPLHYWYNWPGSNIATTMAIGIFTDRRDIYEEGLNQVVNGCTAGMLYHAMPFVFHDHTAQWQESCRDQGHTTLGIGVYGAICEMAWSQGDDIYSLSDNRFLKAAEYVSSYNRGEAVQSAEYVRRWQHAYDAKETTHYLSSDARGSDRSIYTAIYNHYVNRMGMSSPVLEKELASGLELGQTNGDEPGWQSLTFANIGGGRTAQIVERDKLAGKEIKEGKYRITSFLSGKALVLSSDGSGSLASTAVKEGDENQYWNIESVGGGEYKIVHCATGKAIQLPPKNYNRGAQFIAGTYTGDASQKFAIIYNKAVPEYNGVIHNGIKYPENFPDGHRIVSSMTSLCMALSGDQQKDDTPIIQWTQLMNKGQTWDLEYIGEFSREEGLEEAKGRLIQEVEKAKGINTDIYSKPTADALCRALEKAEDVLSDTAITVAKAGQAEEGLQTAIKGLERMGDYFAVSGNQGNADGTYLVATNEAANEQGTSLTAAYEQNVTATGKASRLNSARIGYLNFDIPEDLEAAAVQSVKVSVNVKSVNGNMGSYRTKAALFEVALPPSTVNIKDTTTYPAVGSNYGKEAAVYSEEWIGADYLGQKTFNVTDIVKKAVAQKKGYVSFRLQTVVAGFNVAYEGEDAPKLVIEAQMDASAAEQKAALAIQAREAKGKDVSACVKDSADAFYKAVEKAERVSLAAYATEGQIQEAMENLEAAGKGLQEMGDYFYATGVQSAPEKSYTISTGEDVSANGTEVTAAYEENVTGIGQGSKLSGSRVGYLNFKIPEGTLLSDVAKARVKINVAGTASNLGSCKMKAALFQVGASPCQVVPRERTTFAAKDNDYGKDAAIYSRQWIAAGDLGEKSFDVTEAVQEAVKSGKSYVSFRLQTVMSGFDVASAGNMAPRLEILSQEEKRAEDAEAASAVDEKIKAIGVVELTEDCRMRIETAREAYRFLLEEQKKFVKESDTLTAAELEYLRLEEEKEQDDKQKAARVDEEIAGIGTIELTKECMVKLQEVQGSYELLSPEQKQQVTKAAILTEAKAEYRRLQEIQAGASGSQGAAGTFLVSTGGSKTDSSGSKDKAAYEKGVTASGEGSALGSTRVGYLSFLLPLMGADEIEKAELSIYVTEAHGNIGNEWTKAGLYQVDEKREDVNMADEATYPAKDGYAKDKTLYSKEIISKTNIGTKTFDVTEMLKETLSKGSLYISFRLQTVISGFYFSNEGENAPVLDIVLKDQTENKIMAKETEEKMTSIGKVKLAGGYNARLEAAQEAYEVLAGFQGKPVKVKVK